MFLFNIFGDDESEESADTSEEGSGEDTTRTADELGEDLADVGEVGAEQQLKDLENDLSEVRSATDENSSAIDRTEGRIDQLNDDLDAIEKRTAELSKLYDVFVAEINPMVSDDLTELPERDGEMADVIVDDEPVVDRGAGVFDEDTDDGGTAKTTDTAGDPDEHPSEMDSGSGPTDHDTVGESESQEREEQEDEPAIEREGEAVQPDDESPEEESAGSKPAEEDSTETPDGGTGTDSSGPSPPGDDSERLLPGTIDEGSLPLDEMPSSSEGQVLLRDWILSLMEETGRQGTRDLLRRFEELGYITEEFRGEVIDTFVGYEGDEADVDGVKTEKHLSYILYLTKDGV